MAQFSPGQSIELSVDPSFLNNQLSSLWSPLDVNSIAVVKSSPARFESGSRSFDFPLPLGSYLSDEVARLIIRADNSMSIGGMDANFTISSFSASQLYYQVDGFTLAPRSLDKDEYEKISKYRGYPIRITTSVIRAATSVYRIFPVGDILLHRAEINIDAWVGGGLSGGGEVALVDIDGNPLIWPSSLSVGSFSEADKNATSPLPAFASAVAGSARAGDETKWNLLKGGVSEAAANVIGVARVITSPGRADTDGYTQPPTYPAGATKGRITLVDRLLVGPSGNPNRTVKFRGEVLSSDVSPNIVDPLSGAVAIRSSHILEVIIHDRDAAGLTDTPSRIFQSDDAPFEAGGTEFYLADLSELQGRGVRVTLTTDSGIND